MNKSLQNLFCGAEGRNRTGTDKSPEDFESTASTNFTTSALGEYEKNCSFWCQEFFGLKNLQSGKYRIEGLSYRIFKVLIHSTHSTTGHSSWWHSGHWLFLFFDVGYNAFGCEK